MAWRVGMQDARAASKPVSDLQLLRKQYAKAPEEPQCAAETVEVDIGADADAVDEWEEVSKRTAELRAHAESAEQGTVKSQSDAFAQIGYSEVERWLDQLVVDPQISSMKADDPWRAMLSMGRDAQTQGHGIDFVWFLSHQKFDFNDVFQFRMIRTIYMALTRNATCSRIGSHWEVIGFQNTDPCMDINRFGGLLNVFLMMYFHAFFPDIFRTIFLLSQDNFQEFPFACTSINITQLVLTSLLDGHLKGIFSERSTSHLKTTCQMYCASFYQFYKRWKTLRRTIEDFEKTKHEVRDQSPEQLLEDFDEGVKAHKEQNDPQRSVRLRIAFTDLCGNEDSGEVEPALADSGSVANSRMKSYLAGRGGIEGQSTSSHENRRERASSSDGEGVNVPRVSWRTSFAMARESLRESLGFPRESPTNV